MVNDLARIGASSEPLRCGFGVRISGVLLDECDQCLPERPSTATRPGGFVDSQAVRGWTYNELLVLMGLFFAINGVRQALIQPNLARMSEYIRLGMLDFLLTKPILSQFMVSLRHVGIYNCLDPILGFGLVAVALVRRGEPVSVADLAGFAVLAVTGIVVMYAAALAVQSLAVWAIGAEGLDDLIQGMVEAGRFPVQMYRGIVRALLTFTIPVAMLTTFPADTLLGRGSWRLVAVAVAVAVVLLVATSRLWILVVTATPAPLPNPSIQTSQSPDTQRAQSA